MIDANSILGLFEYAAVKASHDFAETGALNPGLRAEQAVDPEAQALNVARANGVLTALIVPQSGKEGIVAGQSALIRPAGWTTEQMTVASGISMNMRWPQTPDQSILLRNFLRDARADLSKRPARRNPGGPAGLESMRPVLEGRMPLMVHVDRAADIREALAFSRREKLRIVIVGGAEAWRVAGEIAAHHVPVILGSAHGGSPRRWEGYDTIYASAGRLAAAGVELAIANDGNVAATRTDNLPYQAATYAAYGLGDEAALHAITLGPAEILGVADRLGSLDVGKAATIFVSNGDILDIRNRVERAWIDGNEVDLAENHHTRLYETYRRRYRGEQKDAVR